MSRYEYKPVANQRKICVNKAVCNSENLYTVINKAALGNARRELTPSGFALWTYLAENQDKYTFYLSCVDACNECGFGKTAYHKAFNELVTKKYLLPDEVHGNHFDFNEIKQ